MHTVSPKRTITMWGKVPDARKVGERKGLWASVIAPI